MGTRNPSTEPAPAYDELFDGHARPANTVSGYAPIAQAEQNTDIEQNPHQHNHTHHQSFALGNPATTVDNLPPPAEHFHCESCDRLLERKQQRNNERHCCTMVALTFIISFLCLMMLGIVVVNAGK